VGKGLVPALVHRGEQFYLSVSKGNATPLSWTQSATHYVLCAQIFTLTAGMTPTPPLFLMRLTAQNSLENVALAQSQW